MVIGGYQAFSLSDYPGVPSAVVFTQGCNWRCPFCHNSQLLPAVPPDGEEIAVGDILDALRERRGLLQGVVVSGGEPAIHQDLPGLLAQLRGLGLKVKLDTNGSCPGMLEAVFSAGLVDYVAMDIKAPPDGYERLAGRSVDISLVRRSISLIAASGLPHHFRTTWVPHLLAEGDREGILALVPAGSRHAWQRYVPPQLPGLGRTAK